MAVWRHLVFLIIKATRAQAHTSARAPTPMHAYANAHTDKYVRLTAFLRQQLFSERVSMVHCLSCHRLKKIRGFESGLCGALKRNPAATGNRALFVQT